MLERGHDATLMGFVLWIKNIHVIRVRLILAIQMLQCVADCCMQRIAMSLGNPAHMHACYPTSSSGMQCGAVWCGSVTRCVESYTWQPRLFESLRPYTTHCNTLQNYATLCHTLQHSATLCNTLQHSATLCNSLQHLFPMQHTHVACSSLSCGEWTERGGRGWEGLGKRQGMS